jgi:hypothetical protein
VLADVGRKLFVLGLSMAVVTYVMMALFTAARVPLPEELIREAYYGLGMASLVSAVSSLVTFIKSFGVFTPVEIVRNVQGIALCILVSAIASSGILTVTNTVLSIAMGSVTPETVAILSTLKAVTNTVIPLLISLYTIQRILGIPID